MSWIIRIEVNESGARPPIQRWDKVVPPIGYAICTDAQKDVFYSSSPYGFVNLTIEGDDEYKVVTNIEVNQELVDKWNEEHPYVEPTEEETTDDVVNALIGYEGE